MDDREWWTVPQIAKAWDVSPGWVRRWIERGELWTELRYVGGKELHYIHRDTANGFVERTTYDGRVFWAWLLDSEPIPRIPWGRPSTATAVGKGA